MANHFDLEEQEQLDQLKHFWKQYGNIVSWFLIVVFGAFAAWNGYQWWTKRQAEQASGMYEEVTTVYAGGDLAASEKAFADMRSRFPSTAYMQQAGLLLAKQAYLSGKQDVAQHALRAVMNSEADVGLSVLARIRLAGLLIEGKQFDESEKILSDKVPLEFAGLIADKKADSLLARGQTSEAAVQYKLALQALPERDAYRRLVEVKLAALGAHDEK